MKKIAGLLLLCSQSVTAQYTFQARIFNEDNHQPLSAVSAMIPQLHKDAVSDTNGIIIIRDIPPGKFIVQFSSVGFKDKERAFSFPMKRDDTMQIVMESSAETLQDVVISTTRVDQKAKNAPLTIQVIDKEDIEEGTAMSPGNIRELLTELSGTQLQQTSAVSGNVTIRLQGLDGRYTQLLKDGFPLYGGFSGGLSIMQVPPLDLRQVEIIKGAGSALYGGDAIAGIINLITRTPDTLAHADAIFNQTLKGGTDLSGFYSERSLKYGITILATASRQNPFDVNMDGFTDLPKLRQLTIAPTLFWYPSDSTTVRLRVNSSTEIRDGGDIYALEHGSDSLHPFLQHNHTDRDDYQFSLTHKGKHKQTLSIKNTVGYFYRSITQPGQAFSGSQVTSYTEASYGFGSALHRRIVGLDAISDQFMPDASHKVLSYEHNTLGFFAQDDWTVGKKANLETGIRTDIQGSAYFLPRLALLFKITPHLTTRIGGGMAYKVPTVFNAQAEEDGYNQVYPIASSVQNERSASVNASFNYHGRIGDDIEFVLDQNFFYTRLTHALIAQSDSLQRGWLYYINAPAPIISKGSETNLKFSLDELSLSLSYTYTDAIKTDQPGNAALPLAPRSKFVASLMYEEETNWKAGIEGFYTGNQYLDNGYITPSFWTFDVMAEKSFGRFSMLLNVENFTDTRQSRFGPLYAGTAQNPVFNEIYAPLEGIVGNIALRFKL
jgi:outer membrane receptor for ferrienterochelin and colicins